MANGWNTYNGLNEDTLCLHRSTGRMYDQESVEVDWVNGEVRLEVDCGRDERAAVYMDREAAERLRRFLNEKLGG